MGGGVAKLRNPKRSNRRQAVHGFLHLQSMSAFSLGHELATNLDFTLSLRGYSMQ